MDCIVHGVTELDTTEQLSLLLLGFPDSSVGKESACNAGDLGLIPGFDPWVQSLGREDPLEKGMATHSSILAWRILWMEEPGRLQSTGSQRVRHD